jgi:hypothetical protein
MLEAVNTSPTAGAVLPDRADCVAAPALTAPPPPGWRPSAAARLTALAVLGAGRLSAADAPEAIVALEADLAATLGVAPERVRTFASGSGALYACLVAAGAEAGRDVVVSALAPSYVVGAIRLTGARPLPVDVDEGTLAPDPAAVRRALGPRTAAILWTAPVAGGAGDVAPLAATGVPVVVDAAHLLGGRDRSGRAVGARAFAGAFSLAWGKTLSAGEGGVAVAADRRAHLGLSRLARDPLSPLAVAGRLAPVAAVLARAELADLAARNERRRRVADRLRALADAAGVATLGGGDGLAPWVGRFATASAAALAERRADELRLELRAPRPWPGPADTPPVARATAQRVRTLVWWDAAAARPAEIETLAQAFARALGTDARHP